MLHLNLLNGKLLFIMLISYVNGQASSGLIFGIDSINKRIASKFQSKKWALLTNQSGYSRSGKRSLDYLLSYQIPIGCVLVPEHGFYGTIQANESVAHDVDKKTKIPIISLYKNIPIKHNFFDSIDGIIVDLQDVGIRHYTYISTLLAVLKQAAFYKKIIVVCDRPNPLGGLMQGPLVDSELISFISCAAIPLRHGMTIGELAHYFNYKLLDSPAQLWVIPMHKYSRTPWPPGENFPILSPNIKNIQSCLGYSFLGLLGEIRPLEVGVGTDHAFQYLMLPSLLNIPKRTFIELQNLLNSFGIKSMYDEYYNVVKKKKFVGIKFSFSSFVFLPTTTLLLSLVNFFKKNKIDFIFAPSFDKCMGTSLMREWSENKVSYQVLVEKINCQTQGFFKKARDSFFYLPYPTPVLIPKNL